MRSVTLQRPPSGSRRNREGELRHRRVLVRNSDAQASCPPQISLHLEVRLKYLPFEEVLTSLKNTVYGNGKVDSSLLHGYFAS